MRKWLHSSSLANAAQVAGLIVFAGLGIVGLGVGLWQGEHYVAANFMYGGGAVLIFLGVLWFVGAVVALAKESSPNSAKEIANGLANDEREALHTQERFFRDGCIDRVIVKKAILESLRIRGVLSVRSVTLPAWPNGTPKAPKDCYDLTAVGLDVLNEVCRDKPPAVVVTPAPVLIAIDRSPVQMVQRRWNMIKRSLKKSWNRERHGF